MTFQQLSYLVEVSKCNSINQAAESFFVSQTAVSVAIKALEEEIGMQLIERSTKGVVFTPEGRQFVIRAASILEQERLLANMFRHIDHSGIEHSFSVSSMRFPCFKDAYTKTINSQKGEHFFYRFHSGDIDQVIEDVSTRRSDIGIISITEQTEKAISYLLKTNELKYTEIIEAPIVVLCRKNHPLKKLKKVTQKDLFNYPYIYFERNTGSSLEFAEEYQFSSMQNFKETICLNSSSISSTLTENTDAIVVGTGLLSPNVYTATDIVALDDAPVLHIGYITHKHVNYTDDIVKFIGLLIECAHEAYHFREERLRKDQEEFEES